MTMKTVGILILNYLAYEETIACIASLKKQSYQNFEVLIVDNASPNESYERLAKTYESDTQVQLTKTEENLGFAKGNNVGIAYFRQKKIFNILVINGDTLFTNEKYLEKLVGLKTDPKVAMIGTRIKSRDGVNQNPIPIVMTTQQDTKVIKNKFKIIRLGSFFGLDRLLAWLRKEKKVGSKDVGERKSQMLDPTKEGLHGSALYFTDNYLTTHLGFYPDTFLYFEEELLALVCRKLGFTQFYFDEIEIYHKEDASSSAEAGHQARKAKLKKLAFLIDNVAIMDQAIQSSEAEIRGKVAAKNAPEF